MKILNNSFKNHKVNYRLFFLLILVVGIFLRLYNLGYHYVWVDEPFSLVIAKETVFNILRYSSVDPNPPLYYLMLHYWMIIFGDSLFMARLLSVIIGVVAMLFFYFIVKKLFNKQIAFITFIIISLSPYAIYYSRISRGMTLLFLFSLLAFYFFVRYFIQKSGRRSNLIGFVIFSSLALYAHYFYLFFLATLFISYIIFMMRQKDYALRSKLLYAFSTIFLLFFFWLPFFLMRVYEQSVFLHWTKMQKLNIFDVIYTLFIKTIIFFLSDGLFIHRLLILVLFFILLYLVMRFYHKFKNEIKKPGLIQFFVLFIIVEVVLFSLYGFLSDRYIMYSLVVYLPLLSLIIVSSQRWFRWGLLLLFLLINGMVYQIIYSQNNLMGYSWKETTAILNNLSDENDCVVLNNNNAVVHYKYFYRNERPRLIYIVPNDIYDELPKGGDRMYHNVRYMGYLAWINMEVKDNLYQYLSTELESCANIWTIFIYDNTRHLYDPYSLVLSYFNLHYGEASLTQVVDNNKIILRLYKKSL